MKKQTRKSIKEDNKLTAKAQIHPIVTATETIRKQDNAMPGLDIQALSQELIEQNNLMKAGNLERCETMLLMQAHSLDGLFADLINLGRINIKNINVFEKFMRLGLKAQSQCRSTLETLAEIKNPKPYIQNNRAEYQQVNNNAGSSCARKKLNQGNELLEKDANEPQWMDTRETKQTIRNDPALETLGTKHRS